MPCRYLPSNREPSLPTHKPLARHQEVLATNIARLTRIPTPGVSSLGVDRANSLTRDSAGTRRVTTKRVVQPSLMALHIDGCTRNGDGVQSVSAGVVNPGGSDRVGDIGLETSSRITKVAIQIRPIARQSLPTRWRSSCRLGRSPHHASKPACCLRCIDFPAAGSTTMRGWRLSIRGRA